MMKLTTTPPNKPGHYWHLDARYRIYVADGPHVVHVRDFAGHLAVDNWRIPGETKGLYWAGPLEEVELPDGINYERSD